MPEQLSSRTKGSSGNARAVKQAEKSGHMVLYMVATKRPIVVVPRVGNHKGDRGKKGSFQFRNPQLSWFQVTTRTSDYDGIATAQDLEAVYSKILRT